MTGSFAATLEDEASSIATDVVAFMEDRNPDLFKKYGKSGRARCLEDTEYHVRHLAAALDAEDASEFSRYRGWLIELLEPRGVPVADIDANFSALGEVLQARYGRTAKTARSFLGGSNP